MLNMDVYIYTYNLRWIGKYFNILRYLVLLIQNKNIVEENCIFKVQEFRSVNWCNYLGKIF